MFAPVFVRKGARTLDLEACVTCGPRVHTRHWIIAEDVHVALDRGGVRHTMGGAQRRVIDIG